MDENEYSAEETYEIYEDIKKRINDRFEVRTQLAGNLAGFVGASVVLLFLDNGSVLPSWLDSLLPYIMGLWLIGLFVHFANWLLSELRERALRNEIERSGIGLYQRRLAEKRKREAEESGERLVRLTDDGEIVDFHDQSFEHDARTR